MRYLVLLALLLVGCASDSTTFNPAVSQVATPTPTASPATTVRLGAIISQDAMGDPDTQASLKLAEQDVNAYLAAAGSERRVSLSVEGTGYDPAKALAALQKFQGLGIKAVVGPETSAELAAVATQAATGGTLLVSHGATAGSLNTVGDGIFRLVPSDLSQSEVIADQLAATGATSVVIAYRDDVFGRDLLKSVTARCAQRGITVLASILVPVASPDPAGVVRQIEAAAAGRPNVAVQLSVFGDDAAPLFENASPALAALRWVGSDGTAKSREIATSPVAARFAIATGFVNPLFALPQNAKTRRIVERIGAASGTEAQALSVTAYDAVWLTALTSLQGPSLIPAFPTTADNYFGGSGWTQLDAAGDRIGATYDLWKLFPDGQSFVWRSAGQVSTDAR